MKIRLTRLNMFFLFILSASSYADAEKTDLRILWTNDTHGYLSPLYHREEGDNQYIDRAKREGKVGGFAYIASLVKQQRSELPDRTLFLDSGDSWHGTVVPVRMGGSPVVEVMNAMGYDAMVPGNVDFFYDQKTLQTLFSAAQFPIVAANIYDADWGERAELKNVQPYIIKKIGKLKIAIIGMTYHWMSKVTSHRQWTFGLRAEEIQNDIDYLRKQKKVDLVILLSHMGWKVDEKYAELVNGIDVIVGAHTHDILYRPTLVDNKISRRTVLIVQCGSHGKMLGQLDLKINGKRVTAFHQTLFPIRASEIRPDPEIQSLIQKLRAPYEKELKRVIGVTGTILYRQGTWQSTADNLIVDALRARSQQQVAVSEPGRYGATILPGPITVEDIYNLVPTESHIYHMQFSGRDLRNMLEAAIDNVVTENAVEQIGGNMWRFSGLSLKVDLRKTYPDRIQAMYINEKPVIDDQLYTLAEFNLFLRNNPSAIDIVKTDRVGPHEIISYIEERQHISPKLDKRLTDHHGNFMSDHIHLNEIAKQTGAAEIKNHYARIYQYQGQLDSAGYLKIQK